MERGIKACSTSAYTNNIGWKAVEGKLLSCLCNVTWMAKSVKRFERSNGLDTALYKNYLYLYVAPKALLKVVRCSCKMGCDTLRCSCSKAGLDCSTGCGQCRCICANMYENIIYDNEYDEET